MGEDILNYSQTLMFRGTHIKHYSGDMDLFTQHNFCAPCSMGFFKSYPNVVFLFRSFFRYYCIWAYQNKVLNKNGKRGLNDILNSCLFIWKTQFMIYFSFIVCNLHSLLTGFPKSWIKKMIHDTEKVCCVCSELGTLEWWISGLMLNPLFLLISRLT